jgi:hypothetical protein
MNKLIRVVLTLMFPGVLSMQAAPVRVLILDGQSNHRWQLTTPVLKKVLDETGMFQTDVLSSPARGGNFSAFKPEFGKYQVVVMNYNNADDTPEWPPDVMRSFESYLHDGGGLVAVHSADNSFPGWRDYNLMIGVGGWGNRNEKWGPFWYFRDGKLISDTSPGPAGSHSARLPFQVTIRDTEHPITKSAAWHRDQS